MERDVSDDGATTQSFCAVRDDSSVEVRDSATNKEDYERRPSLCLSGCGN